MPSLNKNLKDDLIKISIDKFLIGMLLILLGSFATNLVEKIKSERSFSIQLNRMRVEKISEVWEKVYLFESATETAIKGLRSKSLNEPREFSGEEAERVVEEDRKFFKNLFRQSDSLHSDLIDLANKNRFWLGEESYSEIQNYIASTLDYLYALEDKPVNDEKVRRFSEKREKSRASIKKIRDKLLEE
jgi:hypothetical protein